MKTIKTLLIAASLGLATLGTATAVYAAGAPSEMPKGAMKHEKWSFNGAFGKYDHAAAQRGYQVYKEVCSSCHALDHLSFRHLAEKGAPFYDSDFPNPNDNPLIKGFAAEWEISDMFEERLLDDPTSYKSLIAARTWGKKIKVESIECSFSCILTIRFVSRI